MSNRLALKFAAFPASIALMFVGLAACNGGSGRACASPMVQVVQLRPGSSGGGSSSGSRSGGVSRPPSNSGARTSSGKSGSKPPSNSGAGRSTPPPNSGARPSSTPVGGTPARISGNNYTYHGTDGATHVYVYHPASYWTRLGAADPFNPFDPRNFYNPLSPYFHHHIAC